MHILIYLVLMVFPSHCIRKGTVVSNDVVKQSVHYCGKFSCFHLADISDEYNIFVMSAHAVINTTFESFSVKLNNGSIFSNITLQIYTPSYLYSQDINFAAANNIAVVKTKKLLNGGLHYNEFFLDIFEFLKNPRTGNKLILPYIAYGYDSCIADNDGDIIGKNIPTLMQVDGRAEINKPTLLMSNGGICPDDVGGPLCKHLGNKIFVVAVATQLRKDYDQSIFGLIKKWDNINYNHIKKGVSYLESYFSPLLLHDWFNNLLATELISDKYVAEHIAYNTYTWLSKYNKRFKALKRNNPRLKEDVKKHLSTFHEHLSFDAVKIW